MFPHVPLAEIIRPIERPVVPVPGVIYRQIGVRLWGEGAYERESMDGGETKYKTLSRMAENDIVVNKIWARNGSVAVVTKPLEGTYGSGEFPTFTSDRNCLEPRWFHWLTKTKWFWGQCDLKSRGTSGKNRIRPEKFLQIEIPLPPLPEQQRIVAMIEALAARIVEARRFRLQSGWDADSLFLSALNHIFKQGIGKYDLDHVESPLSILKKQKESYSDKDNNYNNAHPHDPMIYADGLFEIPKGWIWTDLGSVLSHLVDCVNDTPDFSNIDTGFIGLKSTNIRPYKFDLSQRWYVTADDCSRWNRREAPRAGDIILTREAPMGYACILPSGVDVCLTQRLLLLRTDQQFIENRYILHYINSPHFQNQILEDCRGLTTPHIRVKDAPFFLIPLPPKEEQRRIIAYLDSLQTQVDALKKLQAQTAAELDALLPAILDRAFKGNL